MIKNRMGNKVLPRKAKTARRMRRRFVNIRQLLGQNGAVVDE